MEVTHKNTENGGFFIAEEDGKRMGYLSYEWANPAKFAILHTVVEEAFQGRGVAKALVNAAVTFARENGHVIMPLCPYAEKVFMRDSAYDDVNADKLKK